MGNNRISTNVERIPTPVLTVQECEEIVRDLGLPPRQARIVELILRDKKDKQIAATLGFKRPTVRTYLKRIFIREGVTDRVELVLSMFARHLRNDKRRG